MVDQPDSIERADRTTKKAVACLASLAYHIWGLHNYHLFAIIGESVIIAIFACVLVAGRPVDGATVTEER